jgi:nucleotidyltransferase/DNA polymerase involved in DNA repair
MNETFSLIDCNNFYVSCERLFRPDLEGKPVIVLSNNDGDAISRSNESKALGVKWETLRSRFGTSSSARKSLCSPVITPCSKLRGMQARE